MTATVFEVRPTSISFGEGPPQLVVDIEHLPEAVTYALDQKITSIEVATHATGAQPVQVDFGFLSELPHLTGLECRMNVSKKSDLAPVHALKGLVQLAWPARTTPPVDLSCFPKLEDLSFKQLPDTPGWDRLTRLKNLRLSVSRLGDLWFLASLESLVKLELSDSPTETLDGLAGLSKLEVVDIVMLSKLADISALATCERLTDLSVEKTKKLTDFSSLASSKSIENLRLLTPVASLDFVPRMKALKTFFSHEVLSNDLSPLAQAKSLQEVDVYPEKRSYSPSLDEIKASLGL
jgi:hypothetical protein